MAPQVLKDGSRGEFEAWLVQNGVRALFRAALPPKPLRALAGGEGAG